MWYGYGRNDAETFTYDYKGSEFQLVKWSSYGGNVKYKVVGLTAKGSCVEVPGKYNNGVVVFWGLEGSRSVSSKNVFPGVEELIIPSELDEIDIDNDTFPNLKHLTVAQGNQKYSSDGKFLLNKAGDRLILAMAGGRDPGGTVIPKEIKKISSFAFKNTVCRHIVFENPKVIVDDTAFMNSAWLSDQGDIAYIGNMLFSVLKQTDYLELPQGIARIHEKAFSSFMPKELVTYVLPSARIMSDKYRKCRYVTLKNKTHSINWNALRSWDSLESIHLPEHKRYKEIDGVVFSKDGKTLLFYPKYRTNRAYTIPDGVTAIARNAFSEAVYLEELIMPDSVRSIRQAAFYKCSALRLIQLSQNITEIVDGTVFQPSGVFEDCKSLEEIELPARINYIGADAFWGCPLKRIHLPDKLEYIGERAFAGSRLGKIELPRSVRFVGAGALMGIPEVTAYEGTARGLIAAIESTSRGSFGIANIVWKGALIRMLGKNGQVKDTIRIPQSLVRSMGSALEAAWNSAEFDYEEYDTCFDQIQDSEEKIEFAAHGVKRMVQKEDSAYENYLRRMSSRIIDRIIESGEEENVITYVKQGYLSANSLNKALKQCNEKGLNAAAAYILHLLKKDGKTRKTACIRI